MSAREGRGISSSVDVRRYLKYSHLPLALYGAAGTAGKLRADCFNYASMTIDAICDSDRAKHGQMFHNLVILSPEELVRRHPDANILLTVLDKYIPEVYSRLRSLGVRPDRIFKWIQAYSYSPFPLKEFSVCPWRDLFRFADRFADDESRGLFRRRYRHWLLRDRPENLSFNLESAERPGLLVYRDAGELCADVDWLGDLAGREILLDFENADGLAPRAMFALAAARPDGVFLLREGSSPERTRLWVAKKETGRAV